MTYLTMTYKETLFFIGKCLTINHENHNKILVENDIKSRNIDWDAVVKVSTGHFVFPALYCNLSRANFLHYLPKDLVLYMKHITDLNRKRNQEIIEQAREINELLLANNITPIFLKGTGNLLEGLYVDIGERMVGDIDFIVSRNNYIKVIEIFEKFAYAKVHNDTKHDFPIFRHYHRLQKQNKIAAVEIHKELIIEKHADEFNYKIIEKDCLILNSIKVISFENQLVLSIIAKQINDDGIHYKNIALRNAYDLFLLSKKTNAKTSISKFIKLKKPLNYFIAISYLVFNKPESLKYNSTLETKKYLTIFNNLLNNPLLRNKIYAKIEKKLFIKQRLGILYKSIFDKNLRNWLIKRITEKTWYAEKLANIKLLMTKKTS